MLSKLIGAQKSSEGKPDKIDLSEPLHLENLQSLKKALKAAEIQKAALESELNKKEQSFIEYQKDAKEQEDHLAEQVGELQIEVSKLKTEVECKRKECKKLKKQIKTLKEQYAVKYKLLEQTLHEKESKLQKLSNEVQQLQKSAEEIAKELSDEKTAHTATKTKLEKQKSTRTVLPDFKGASLFPMLNLDLIDSKQHNSLVSTIETIKYSM